MKRNITKFLAALALLVFMMPSMAVWGQTRDNYSGTFTRITSVSDFVTGYYVITGSQTASTNNKALGNSVDSNKRIPGVQVSISNNQIQNPDNTVVYYITVDNNSCTFLNVSTNKYMYQANTTSGKGMGFQDQAASITLSGYNSQSPIGFKFTLNGNSNNFLKWNNGSSWYANYANDYSTTMTPVELFKLEETPSTDPVLSVNSSSIDFGSVAINPTSPYEETFEVSFANLTQDLTVSVGEGLTGVSVAPATISKTATSPATVTVSYNPTTAGTLNGNITVSNQDDGVSAAVAVSGSAYDPTTAEYYTLHTSGIVEGDYVIYYDGKAMKNTVSSQNRLDYTTVTPSSNSIINPDASIVWHIAQSGNYWTIYNASVSQFAASTDNKNQATLIDEVTDNAKWTVTGSQTYEFENLARSTGNDPGNKWLRNNGTNGFACYSSSTGGALSLYKKPDANQGVATSTTITVPSGFITDVYQQTTNAGTLTASVTETVSGNAVSGATVTWSSSDTDVATIASDGTVTLVAAGTTTITAAYAGVTNQYQASSATYSLTVTNSTPVTGDSFIFNTDEGLQALNITKPAAGAGTDLVADHAYEIGNVTMTITHGGTNTRVWNSSGSTDLRVYSGGSLVFTVPEGNAITKITVTGSAPNNFDVINDGVWTASGAPVKTVTLTATGTAKVNTITVEYEANTSVVAAPTLPASVNFLSQMTVTITNNSQGATVYYTTDGSDPTTSSTRVQYSQAFTVNATTTVKAVAYVNPNYSPVVEATYTLVQALNSIQAVFDAATDTETNVFVNFNNYVVSGVSTNGKSVFVTDNTGKGFVMYFSSDMSATYAAGQVLSGTEVPCNLKLQTGFAELLNVNATNLTITDNGTVTTSGIAMADLAGINTGALVHYNGLTCVIEGNKTKLTDGTTTIQLYNALYAFGAFTDGSIYNITGVYQQYNSTKEVLPRSAADIEAVYTLNITGYTSDESKAGYYLIASPVTVNIEDVQGLADGTFDLYSYDNGQTLEWINYEPESGSTHPFTTLEPGTGYLYAKKATTAGETFSFTLTGTPYNGDGEIELAAGWNLVGNPFGVAAEISMDYYALTPDATDLIPTDASTNVAAMQGVFVNNTTGASSSVIFMEAATGTNNGGEGKLALNVSRNRGNLIDRAIVRFGEGNQLPKFQLFENSTKLYIAQGNEDYAIVNSAAEGEMPVSFRASENGAYTLAVETENMEMDYLHLIDNMTGMDVDLLQTPSYTFEASTRDHANRFRLVFKGNSANEQTTETFAYFNGSSWTVSNLGEATLQVVDVMGRLVSTETINGNATINLNETAGIYMLRLINGNDVKVQKIVVR